jgi:hypothetical protein
VIDKTAVAGLSIFRYRGCGENANIFILIGKMKKYRWLAGERINCVPYIVFDNP